MMIIDDHWWLINLKVIKNLLQNCSQNSYNCNVENYRQCGTLVLEVGKFWHFHPSVKQVHKWPIIQMMIYWPLSSKLIANAHLSIARGNSWRMFSVIVIKCDVHNFTHNKSSENFYWFMLCRILETINFCLYGMSSCCELLNILMA